MVKELSVRRWSVIQKLPAHMSSRPFCTSCTHAVYELLCSPRLPPEEEVKMISCMGALLSSDVRRIARTNST